MFVGRLNGGPIGYTVVGIMVIDKNAVITVRISRSTHPPDHLTEFCSFEARYTITPVHVLYLITTSFTRCLLSVQSSFC